MKIVSLLCLSATLVSDSNFILGQEVKAISQRLPFTY